MVATDDAVAVVAPVLGAYWAIPFVGVLLSIAFIPLLFPHFWHRHYGAVAVGWALAFLVPFTACFGMAEALHDVIHTLAAEYVPFVVLLGTLFVVAGGVQVTGRLAPTPVTNAGLLGLGTLLASVMGTTGAAILLIRPLIRANAARQHKTHTFVFFIFLVANVGGCLSPIGDPPLFLGFLQGVPFFWPTRHMLPLFAVSAGVLLLLYLALDLYFYRKEKGLIVVQDRMGLRGTVNLLLLAAVVATVVMSGVWKSGVDMTVAGVHVALENIVRDGVLIGLAGLSLWLTPRAVRAGNDFSWFPIVEVAKLFFAIFITMMPVLEMLRAGSAGPFAALVALVNHADGTHNPVMYFWMTGALSSFLDNAPTYLVFFNLAGGDVAQFLSDLHPTLVAISAGAVFMGAMTYIGNAPNFMVRSIVESQGIKMPSFFGFMGWSIVILGPLYGLLTVLFINR